MRKVSSHWAPHRLTYDQTECRLEVANANLSRFNTEGENFLSRIVAVDITWVRSYEPELKRQTAEWHTPSSPRPTKFWRVKIELLIIFTYDNRGVRTTHKTPAS